ncbi:MAG: hypothetical protein ACI9W2_004275 [Gammaproteobacteria bacterium]
MPTNSRYFFVVSMDVDPDKEDFFNEVYDTEHVPYLNAVPGVLSATRTTREPLRMMLAGEERTMDPGDEPKYSVTYEIRSPDVLLSPEWAAAGERGQWASQVRPHTSNRRHILRKTTA